MNKDSVNFKDGKLVWDKGNLANNLKDNRMEHECTQLTVIGEIRAFMESMRGFRAMLTTIIVAIVVQVITFAALWGGLTTTVNQDNKQVWDKLTPSADENRRNIDRIMTKLDMLVSDRSFKSTQDFK